MDELPWKLLETYIKDHPNYLVKHHIDSYNAFWLEQLPEYLREKNPIDILKEPNETNTDYLLKAKIYIGGKEGDKVYIGKPMIYDDENVHFMYPNEARLRNMTYGFSIHLDVLVEYTIQQEGETVERSNTLEKILLGRFPIMLQSKLCVLHGLDRKLREQMGECKNDPGGYFIINGKEKVIVPQEKFGDNMIYVKDDFNDKYSHSAEIRSVSENMAKPISHIS
jgi:DNA-directed RNA polymerase II subunit RPB2